MYKHKPLSSTFLTLFTFLLLALPLQSALAAHLPVFINEIHYDNTGGDVGEGVEIAGPAGMDLAGWSLVLYNGSNGSVYNTVALSGVIPDQQNGMGTLSFTIAGIQNGAPDGIALVDAGAVLQQFLSYEGNFVGVGGIANGVNSTDIGVSEPGSTPIGNSLQLSGVGSSYEDFAWAASQPNTFGAVNTGQTFTGGGTANPVINEFVANHTGSDTEAFVEILGSPSTDYSSFTVLEIEGDSGGSTGVIDAALTIGVTDGGGYWTDPEDMENGTITILVVEDFVGNVGDDLDTDDDGVFDSTPWTLIVDDVAVTDGGGSDITYSSTVLAPNYDGQPFSPGGASRIPNGTDTDSTADWMRNDFDGFGFPGFPGSPALGEAENTPGSTNVAITVITDPVGACDDSATLIHDIQGSGLASTDVGSIREVEAVVTAVFQGTGFIGGYFIQEEDVDIDANPLTSEGLRIFDNANSPAVGDLVRVRGSVGEFGGRTELSNLAGFLSCSNANTLPAVTVLSLPTATEDDFEAVEGMYVTFPQALVISEYFNFDRFNETVLTSVRHLTPTAEFEPGAAAIQAAQDFLLDRITLDDGRSTSNPDPTIHPNGLEFTLANLFRGGDTAANVTGVMDDAFGLYRIQPTQAADYTSVNVRTPAPDPVGGSLKVAAFNVLNYFTTLDDSGPICGPNQDQGCRGADNADEFTRQRDKIISALVDINADVVGLMEIENHPADVPTADLVSGINAIMGAGTYEYIATGAVGVDAIRVAIIYKPATAIPFGAYAILDSSVDVRFNDTKNRPVIAQTFKSVATGGGVTVAVNHLKSKGSACDDVGDPDTGDGAGNCNLTRTSAAEALVDWLASDPTASGDEDSLIIGDLNSYDKEAPIDALIAGGYTDLNMLFGGEAAYTFVFDGQMGYLDYGLANAGLLGEVTGTTNWHINADEADLIDYDTSFKGPNQEVVYAPDAYRSSDHDPVIVGLELIPVADLSIGKTDDPDPVVAGTNLTYTVTVDNAGPDEARDVVVTDNLPAGLSLVSTSGCTNDPAGAPSCTLGTIVAGGSAVFTITAAVDVTLPHETMLSNTASVTSGAFDPDETNNTSAPPTETTVITEAYWDVTKYWNREGGGSVSIMLTCNDVEVATGTATPGAPTRLTVTGFDNGNTACVVTEDVPGGTFEDYSVDCSVDDVVSATVYVCDIGNSASFATFAVRKRFMDGNDETPVTFHMHCNNGLPVDQHLTVQPDTGDFDRGTFEVKFVVTKFSPGEMDCTVYEEPVGGYTASYVCGSVNNPDQVCTDGDPSDLDNFGDGPCFFEDVDSSGAFDAANFCTIRNYPNPGVISISKEWIVEGAGGNTLDPSARVNLESSAYVEGSHECYGQSGWCTSVNFYGPGTQTHTLDVETSYLGTVINLEEDLYDNTFLSENNCGGSVTVYPTGYEGGDGMASCTFTNTAFFEGIPTLNQYGMALLALLMLGVGLLGFRRFA